MARNGGKTIKSWSRYCQRDGKTKTISDTMGNIAAKRLFKPITSGLKDLATPQIPRRRLPIKKRQVPDYGLEIGDDEEVPDYGLEDFLGEEVQPQNNKQLVPKPPKYEDVLKDLETGEKQVYIDPEYMPKAEDLPPGYEGDETPDYIILEEYQIIQILYQLGIANYDDIESQLNQQDISKKNKQSFLSKKNTSCCSSKTKITWLQDTCHNAIEKRCNKQC